VSQWHKMIPCPKGCGNTIRYKGPNSTPSMCRNCYLVEMRAGDGKFKPVRRKPIITKSTRPAPVPPSIDPLLIPQHHLWFERDRVFAYIKDEVGDSARMELSKNPSMEARWDTWRSRMWLRFDQVDDMLCALGLWVGDLGEPRYSGSEKRYPVLEAA